MKNIIPNSNIKDSIADSDDSLVNIPCPNYNIWSTNYTIDRLKEYLAQVKYYEITSDNKTVENRKYYNQAFHMLKIGAFKPTPSYVISLTDFDKDHRLLKELHDLDRETLAYVLCQAVGRIFEDVNSNLYHNSISKVLKVKIEK